MSKNKEILNKWKKEISQYEPLTISQSQELYKKIIECDNEKIKKRQGAGSGAPAHRGPYERPARGGDGGPG